MPSDDQEKAILMFQHALEFMAALFSAVEAKDLLRLVHQFQARLESGEKINPDALTNKGTFGDVILCPENGHKITESQAARLNPCFGYALGLAVHAAEFLWIYERLIVKEKFTTAGGTWSPEIRTTSCRRCSSVWVRRQDIEAVAGIIWARLRVRPLIETGDLTEAMNEALGCTSCFAIIAAVEDILSPKKIMQANDSRAECPSCGSQEVSYPGLKIDWDTVRHNLKKHLI